jgi:hypothetical protein
MLAIFMRAPCASDIAALRDDTRIFRDNSIGMAVTGMLLRAHRSSSLGVPSETNGPNFEENAADESNGTQEGTDRSEEMPEKAITTHRNQCLGDKASRLAKLLQGIMQLVIFSPVARQEYDDQTLLQLTTLRGKTCQGNVSLRMKRQRRSSGHSTKLGQM